MTKAQLDEVARSLITTYNDNQGEPIAIDVMRDFIRMQWPALHGAIHHLGEALEVPVTEPTDNGSA